MLQSGREVSLSEVLGALSYALDLTDGQPKGHSVRCCFIGMHIGKAIGLSNTQLKDLYYTILLKDLGCSSNAARICSIFATHDDQNFKQAFRRIDGSIPQLLSFMLKYGGSQAGLAKKFNVLINFLQNGDEISRKLLDARCQRGSDIALKLRFSQDVADGIYGLDEHWNGGGLPEGTSGKNIHLFSRIALLAQICDVFFDGHDSEAAIKEINSRSGSWFDPELVQTLNKIAQDPEFWHSLASPDLGTKILDLEPKETKIVVQEDYLDEIAEAFAQVVDAKSPYTGGHSERVTVFTDLIAAELNLATQHRRELHRAALLHDIGKLGVSSAILDKPGKLTEAEFDAVKKHPVYSNEILGRLELFDTIKPVAIGHHEKLDGSGYPYGLKGDEINLDTRIVTVADIFDALTADRPYRKAMQTLEAFEILDDMARHQIDAECVKALKSALSMFNKNAA